MFERQKRTQDTSLVSPGGDDRRVLLWHMEEAIHGRSKPVKLKGEHRSNIFCLAFDSSNTKVFSGGELHTKTAALTRHLGSKLRDDGSKGVQTRSKQLPATFCLLLLLRK